MPQRPFAIETSLAEIVLMWLCMAFPGAGAPGDQQMETVAPPRPWHNGSPDKAKAKKLAQKESTKESAKRSPPWSWPPARRTRRSERTGEGLAQQRIGMCGAGGHVCNRDELVGRWRGRLFCFFFTRPRE